MRIPACRPARAGMILLAAVNLAGCGSRDPDALPTVRAEGQVNFMGKPIPKGTLRVVPERGRPAGGAIVDGKFTLGTYEIGDGAIPGTHKIEIIVTEEVPSKVKGGEPVLKHLIPERFASTDTSNLTLTIPPEGSSDLRVDFP